MKTKTEEAIDRTLEAMMEYIGYKDDGRSTRLAVKALLEELATEAAGESEAVLSARLDECHKLRDQMIQQIAPKGLPMSEERYFTAISASNAPHEPQEAARK